MANLVTLQQLRESLNNPPPANDQDLALRLDIAEEMVLNFVNQRVGVTASLDWDGEIATWTFDTVPLCVRGAILSMAGYLYRWRGDDEAKDMPQLALGRLPPDVEMCLWRLRDPALA
jgi:hypothetical protein